MTSFPGEVWGEISKLLISKNWHIRYHLQHLVGSDRNDHLGAGTLYGLPADLYLKWARQDPKERAAVVVRWLPIVEKTSDGSFLWHPALVGFVAEFGDNKEVLSELSTRMHPKAWWGSVVPYIAPLVPLVETWSAHAKVEVRRWARDQVASLKSYISENRKRDEESEAGLF